MRSGRVWLRDRYPATDTRICNCAGRKWCRSYLLAPGDVYAFSVEADQHMVHRAGPSVLSPHPHAEECNAMRRAVGGEGGRVALIFRQVDERERFSPVSPYERM